MQQFMQRSALGVAHLYKDASDVPVSSAVTNMMMVCTTTVSSCSRAPCVHED